MSDTPDPTYGTPNPDDPNAPKRRPKDSEFFELPPDLKKMTPGELPATASSSPTSRNPGDKGDTRKGTGPTEKGGCFGLLLAAASLGVGLVGALAWALLRA